MNNYVFKIFGAPHTFDLYQGNEDEIRYFQNFDNGGKENMKLTIHRMASGKVSYSYLRYNFISSSGRPNSFFGMSVLFDNEYCKDIEKIFDLFDTIYNAVILKNGILLSELKDNQTAQAKYHVQTFAEAPVEVKKVENNIINNLKNHFTEDILPIDSSFLESNSMVKLNDKMDNARIVNALRKYSWVHISPEYSKNEVPIPNNEFLKNLDETIKEAQKKMPTISVKMAKGDNVEEEVNNYLDKTNDSLEKIRTWLENEYKLKKGENPNLYLQKQSELKKLKEHYDDLLENQSLLLDLSNVAGKKTTQSPTPVPQPPVDSNPEPPNPSFVLQLLPKNFSSWKRYIPIIVGTAAISVIIIACVFFIISKLSQKSIVETELPNTENTTTPGKSVDELVNLGDQALDNKDFDTAIAYFEDANKPVLVSTTKEKAAQYWREKAADAKTYQKSIEFLQKTRKYGYDPTAAIEDYKRKIAPAPKRKHKKVQQTTPTCVGVKIIIEDKKGIYEPGDEFKVFARTSSGTICTVGEWSFEQGLWANRSKNPTMVAITDDITKIPRSGKVKLFYNLNGEKVESVTITIIP